MSEDQPGTPAALVRFVMLRHLPAVLVDLPDDGDGSPLFGILVEHGMVVLPRFYGVDLPRGVRVGFTLARDELRLDAEDGQTLLRAPRSGVDPAWMERALQLQGTMMLVGRDLDLDPDAPPRELCDLLDVLAPRGLVAGAIVGVAEQQLTLPLL